MLRQRGGRDGHFLVREKQVTSHQATFALSLMFRSKPVHHLLVKKVAGPWLLNEKETEHTGTLNALIDSFCRERDPGLACSLVGCAHDCAIAYRLRRACSRQLHSSSLWLLQLRDVSQAAALVDTIPELEGVAEPQQRKRRKRRKSQSSSQQSSPAHRSLPTAPAMGWRPTVAEFEEFTCEMVVHWLNSISLQQYAGTAAATATLSPCSQCLSALGEIRRHYISGSQLLRMELDELKPIFTSAAHLKHLLQEIKAVSERLVKLLCSPAPLCK